MRQPRLEMGLQREGTFFHAGMGGKKRVRKLGKKIVRQRNLQSAIRKKGGEQAFFSKKKWGTATTCEMARRRFRHDRDKGPSAGRRDSLKVIDDQTFFSSGARIGKDPPSRGKRGSSKRAGKSKTQGSINPGV